MSISDSRLLDAPFLCGSLSVDPTLPPLACVPMVPIPTAHLFLWLCRQHPHLDKHVVVTRSTFSLGTFAPREYESSGNGTGSSPARSTATPRHGCSAATALREQAHCALDIWLLPQRGSTQQNKKTNSEDHHALPQRMLNAECWVAPLRLAGSTQSSADPSRVLAYPPGIDALLGHHLALGRQIEKPQTGRSVSSPSLADPPERS